MGLLLDLENLVGLLHLHAIHNVWPYAYLSCPHHCFSRYLFGLISFGTLTSPKALCPLAEPLAPDSLGTECAEAAGVTTELRGHFSEGERGLKKKQKTSRQAKQIHQKQKQQITLTCQCYRRTSFSTSESLTTRGLVRPPLRHGRRHCPTNRWTYTLTNNDQLRIR